MGSHIQLPTDNNNLNSYMVQQQAKLIMENQDMINQYQNEQSINSALSSFSIRQIRQNFTYHFTALPSFRSECHFTVW